MGHVLFQVVADVEHADVAVLLEHACAVSIIEEGGRVAQAARDRHQPVVDILFLHLRIDDIKIVWPWFQFR